LEINVMPHHSSSSIIAWLGFLHDGGAARNRSSLLSRHSGDTNGLGKFVSVQLQCFASKQCRWLVELQNVSSASVARTKALVDVGVS
jgi:hypothetical protein